MALELHGASIDRDGLVYRLAQVAADPRVPWITAGSLLQRLADELAVTVEFNAEVDRQLELRDAS